MSKLEKAVVAIFTDTHARPSGAASITGNSMKRMTSLLLDYALTKLRAGEITLREPVAADIPTMEGAR